ncbi:MAG TPA: PepSY domain-containing protein, partial [Spongiibacteraceae bacterium]|nr:PepSY domain-containing protein [Spongiibacteraceae bacterium]
MKNLLLLHRWLGVIACIAVLMFAASGLLHPIMSRTQPQPLQNIAPNATLPAAALPLAEALHRHAIEQFSAASVAVLPGRTAYRVQIDNNTARYFAADDGSEIPSGEAQHAELLARHFSGESTARLQELHEVTDFDADYLWVNHLLPVWRARFERADGLTIYVDTHGNRLATIVDNRKRALQTTFRNMHDFAFLEPVAWLRLPLMLVLLSATFATAAAGLCLFFRLKNSTTRLQRAPLRRWHRRLALLVSLTTLSFSVSGSWHLLQSEVFSDKKTYPAITDTFLTRELSARQPPSAFTLMRVHGTACYRIATAMKAAGDEHAHHATPPQTTPTSSIIATNCIATDSGLPLIDAERDKAVELARHFSQTATAPASAEIVDKFSGEYGFINKRLPVWKIQFSDGTPAAMTRWYVEPGSGTLALRADDNAAREGFFFAYVHK